jgi:predicted DCC family thiol-disulfide oxidoreductase YuxK
MTSHDSQIPEGSVVFFDGVCHLCNASVNFLMRIDKRKKLRYAPLQGKTAGALIPTGVLSANDTVIYLRNTKFLQRSDAVLWMLYDSAWYFKWILIFLLIPRALRDRIYKWIAANRYRWFGKNDTCRIPAENEKHLFLP